MSEVANLDFDRFARRGYPEAVLADGKSLEQCVDIAETWKAKADQGHSLGTVLFTRMTPEKAEGVMAVLPGATWHETARMLAWPGAFPPPLGDTVVVACAGTSDLPVAQEAALTARYLGRNVTEIVDVGVAGLDRILSHRSTLEKARVIVVVAGMEGALASVVAGLVSCPVVAVPTSVGYGASFGGVAALLGMLNSCSPGVSVVNIDNGYGAGHLAAQITAPRDPHE
ncbi:nickel pincer cofactor biosynthesis protein LarB [Flaviflexus massiliensis]|uniref:nickel pincer cofactor biosynthesis protein LarB n=1 Tax=Flaviflexus massiliensis TaxID=1522309 RepID=UPI0006D55DF6|nr:nickel pincer cofactor biosynthesis protein LarB [Flaviflexus massiliensis]